MAGAIFQALSGLLVPATAPATSYANAGGTGARTGIITASDDGSTITGAQPPPRLVDGSFAVGTNSCLFQSSFSAAGHRILFQFSAAKVITETKFYQDTATSHGVWKWQGSNDLVTPTAWNDTGTSFTLGNGVTTQTDTSMSANVGAYLWYSLLGISGTVNSGSWLEEFEFKIS